MGSNRDSQRELADLQSAFKLVVQGYVGEYQVERLIGRVEEAVGEPDAGAGAAVPIA